MSDITYEELTQIILSTISIMSPVSGCRTLPMRNWHWRLSTSYWLSCSSTFLSDITYEELTLHFISVNYIFHLLSDITYEELTPFVPIFPFWRITCMSDITYEELTLMAPKILILSFIFSSLSDITYEELTLSAAAISLARDFKKCRTLPMRNWHLFVISFCIICLLILSICRTLPMRNWHTGYRMFQSACLIRRTLPMRNWHDCRESWKLVLFQWSAVGHYLWGIDTHLRLS